MDNIAHPQKKFCAGLRANRFSVNDHFFTVDVPFIQATHTFMYALCIFINTIQFENGLLQAVNTI